MKHSDRFARILSTLMIAPGILGGLFYWLTMEKSPAAIPLIADSHCQPLGNPCLVRAATFSLTFALPKTLVPLRPFEVEVITQGVEAKQITVDFIMPEMTMPPNQITLIPSDRHNRWLGKAILPLCSLGQSTWAAILELIDKQNRIYRGQLLFSIN